MKKAERAKVLKEIDLPSKFIKYQDTAYYIVQERNLKIMIGILIDSSSNPKDFTINYFITPLFIEFPAFVLTIGDRIGNSWYPEELPLINEEVKNIKILNSFDEIYNIIIDKYSLTNKTILKTLGYISLIKGNNSQALECFSIIIQMANESPFEWFQKEGLLIQNLVNKIINNQVEDIFSELEAIQIRMVTNLKLDPRILTM
jgi:hypothetical protein